MYIIVHILKVHSTKYKQTTNIRLLIFSLFLEITCLQKTLESHENNKMYFSSFFPSFFLTYNSYFPTNPFHNFIKFFVYFSLIFLGILSTLLLCHEYYSSWFASLPPTTTQSITHSLTTESVVVLPSPPLKKVVWILLVTDCEIFLFLFLIYIEIFL